MSNLLLEKIEKANSIAISGHIRPDGDCTGSTLALYNYIKENFTSKKVKVFLEVPSNKFSYMSGFDKIDSGIVDGEKLSLGNIKKDELIYDLCICLDASDDKRLAGNIVLVNNSKDSLTIDHHISHKKYTKDLILDANASSTCEVLARYLDLNKVSKETATCLYTGLVHDTGVFKYPCTSLETMNLAGKLMEKGVEFNKIIDDSFFARDFYANKVLAKALLDSKLYFDGKLIVSYTTKQILDEYKVDIKSLDGVIDELRNTIGIEVAIYLYQLNEDEYKASLRSKSFVDVSKICESLGGGGHIRAAGCSIQGKIEDIIELLIKKVKVEL